MRKSESFSKNLRLSVRYDGKEFRMYDGSPLPELPPNALCELVVSEDLLVNPSERSRLCAKTTVTLVPKGRVVYVGVGADLDLTNLSSEENAGADVRRYAGFQIVPVRLDSDLNLVVRGDEQARLADCKCFIPLINQRAESVNHAFTLLSQVLETGRRSHTANVFTRTFAEHEGRLRELDELRLLGIDRVKQMQSEQSENKAAGQS